LLVYGALVPHPPIIIAEIGGAQRKKAEKTVQAMESLGKRLAAVKPETLLIFSPHGPVFQDGLALRGGRRLSGDLARFGASQTWEWQVDQRLIERILAETAQAELPCLELTDEQLLRYRIEPELDHGVLVPLSFLADPEVRLVATGMSLLPWLEQYELGIAIGRAVRSLPQRIAVIASGDLSHRLLPGASAGYDPRGKEFDETLIELLRTQNWEGLFALDPVLVEKAAECGFRTVLMLLGVFAGLNVESEVLSYEGPFGVGYGVVSFTPNGEEKTGTDLLSRLRQQRTEKLRNQRAIESPFVRLAREAVENHLLGRGFSDEIAVEEGKEQAGAFVSIKKHGQLRGCIGTIFPTQATFVDEIKHNAIAAAFQDPRFDPVQVEVLPDLVFSVDLIKTPEPIGGPEALDPQKYGVIVRKQGKLGLLLPMLAGVETVDEQLRIAKQKAGIDPDAEVELERFEVMRYH
jgi:AmmeMemoRadiSam system protein A